MEESSRLALLEIENMKNNGSLDDATFYKYMMEMAYAFFLKNDNDSCIICVGRCPPEYFIDMYKQHMEEDQFFLDKMVYLSYKFVLMGMVDVGYDVRPNQKGVGRA